MAANAAASEGDNSVKSITIGFLEEIPRVNLRNEGPFNSDVRKYRPKCYRTLICAPFSGLQFPIIKSAVTIVFAKRPPNASSMSSVGLGPYLLAG